MTGKEIAGLIKARRQEIGMTQIELALRASTTQKSISRIETGKDNPSFQMMLTIVRALGMDVVITKEAKHQTVYESTEKG